jgi:hypothetical protein
MLSPIVTFNEDGTAHIELGGGHLIAHHFYTNTNLTATVVEALTAAGCFTDQEHRVVGVWEGPDIFGDGSVSYALRAGCQNRIPAAPIFNAIRDLPTRVRRHLHQPARKVTPEEMCAITDRARHLMGIGALSPTPHNLMAHTTKDTA